MSCAIAMRATKARAPKSTGFVDDLGVGNRLTGGGGVSLRPDLSRHQQGRLRWRDPRFTVDEATSDDWEPDDGSFHALIVVLALPRTQVSRPSGRLRGVPAHRRGGPRPADRYCRSIRYARPANIGHRTRRS